MNLLQVTIPMPTVPPQDSISKKTQEIIEQMVSDPSSFWTDIVHSALLFSLKLVIAVLIYIVGAWLIKRINRLLSRHFHRRKTERTLATFTTSAVSIALTIILIIVTVGTLGVDTTSLAALLAAGGMAIGMALSGTVQNIAGGMMLLIFKPFKAGDWIDALGVSGSVIEVSIASTKILTVDNRVIILPNGALSNGVIDNYNGRPIRQVEWNISLEYGSDVQGVRSVMTSLLSHDERILGNQTDIDKLYQEFDTSKYQLASFGYKVDIIPDPEIVLKSMNDNDITFRIRAWVRGKDYWGVYMNFNEIFYTELPKHGYNFAYPHLDVNLLNNNGSNNRSFPK